MPTHSLIDVSNPENLHWLAVLSSSVILSLASSIVPNYVEATLDVRSHNRSRLFNETAARLHIAYIIFLLALSNDVDKTGNILTWLHTLILVLVFILIVSIIISGRTIKRIQRYQDWEGKIHQCNVVDGVCDTPIGWWVYCKVCFLNGLVAVVMGIFCTWLSVSHVVIKHEDWSAETSSRELTQQKPYRDALEGVYKQIAHQTKDQFEETILGTKEDKLKDSNLHVSYWYESVHDNLLKQLGTTHQDTKGNTYGVNEGSIIGCAYVHPNSSVRWDGHAPAIVWPYNQDKSSSNKQCGYAEVSTINFKSVICATYNNAPQKNSENTVGVCVFSPNVINLPNNKYHDFLKQKAEDFYNAILPILEQKTLAWQ